MNRREFIKAGATASIGMLGMAGCTRQPEDDDEFEDDFDSLSDEPAASDEAVDLDASEQAAFENGSPQNPWTEREVREYLDNGGTLGPEPNYYVEEDA